MPALPSGSLGPVWHPPYQGRRQAWESLTPLLSLLFSSSFRIWTCSSSTTGGGVESRTPSGSRRRAGGAALDQGSTTRDPCVPPKHALHQVPQVHLHANPPPPPSAQGWGPTFNALLEPLAAPFVGTPPEPLLRGLFPHLLFALGRGRGIRDSKTHPGPRRPLLQPSAQEVASCAKHRWFRQPRSALAETAPTRLRPAHLPGGAVGPPRGRDKLLEASLLHTQWALDIKEDDRPQHIEAGGRQGRAPLTARAPDTLASPPWEALPEPARLPPRGPWLLCACLPCL